MPVQGSICVPGTVGLLPIEQPCDIETSCFSKKASLVYHYGSTNPGSNLKLYNSVVTSLAKMFQQRCKADPKSECGALSVHGVVFLPWFNYFLLGLNSNHPFQLTF